MKVLWLCASVCVAFAPATALAASSDWPVAGHDAQATYFNGTETAITPGNAARLHSIWAAAGVTRAIAGGGKVFAAVGGSGGSSGIEVLSPTGRRLAVFTSSSLQLGPHSYDVPRALAYTSGRLLVASPSVLEAVNPASGTRYWRDTVGATYLAVVGNTLLTGEVCATPCGAPGSYALDVATGHVLWRHQENGGGPPTVQLGQIFQRWGYTHGATRVYAISGGGLAGMLPYDAMWTGDRYAAYADAAGGAGRSWLGRVSADGKTVWKFDLGKASRLVPPVEAHGALFAVSNRFHPGVVSVSTGGTYRWGSDIGSNISSMVGANRVLFLLHRGDGRVDVLNMDSGRSLAHLTVPYYHYDHNASLFIANGTIYALAKGTLTALEP